jgi:uncharacterized protein YhjY with autotransporter beta-barrel domain
MQWGISMRRTLTACLAATASFAVIGTALAAPTVISTPNVTTAAGSVNVVFGGQTFVNKGLVGAGRVSATSRDFNGDTLGSFSGMSFIASTWRRNADGTYSGGLYTLPDRGPNFSLNGFPGTFFSNYAARINQFSFTFNPYTGAGDLAQATSSQNQMALTPTGGLIFTDFLGRTFTGLDPVSGLITQNGFTFGAPVGGLGDGRISIDSEALVLAPDGSFYVSDEYQAGIFHFGADGRMIGYIPTIAALTPRIGGLVSYSAADAVAGQTGRRNNQGMEGLSLSPDGRTLFVMLQSAALQDANLGNDAARTTTRLLAYDVSSGATPVNPVGHWVMELPVFNRGNTNGTAPGGAANRTAAQSEILALNSTQLLVLSRDGNGRGNDPTNAANNGSDGRPMIYKSILLIDTAAATNLAGTTRETTAGGAVTTAPGVLDPTITPVAQIELVNVLNTTQLRRLGLNTNVGPAINSTSISEKWEAMGLLPVLEEAAPQDFFLFVGNDNDFIATNGQINGGMTNGSTTITTYDSGFNNDSMFLVYRLTLPTYVDPLYLQAMVETGPLAMDLSRSAATTLAGEGGADTFNLLNGARRSGIEGYVAPQSRLWGTLAWTGTRDLRSSGFAIDSANGLDGTIGYDFAVAEGLRLGAALTYGRFDQEYEIGLASNAEAVTGSLYAAFEANGFFANARFGYSLVELDRIDRPSAYGLTGRGKTDAEGFSADLEGGYMFEVAPKIMAGPVASISWVDFDIDGYLETGAAGGNVVFPDQSFDAFSGSAGAEIYGSFGGVSPSLRVAYNWSEDGGTSDVVRLNSAVHAMATQTVEVGGDDGDSVTVSLALQGADGESRSWFVGYDAEIPVGGESGGAAHRITMGGTIGF